MTSEESIGFMDERGLRWELSEFCGHYRIDADTARHLLVELDRPKMLDTRDFVASCNPKAKILRRVIAILPGGKEKRIFPSVTCLAKFAADYASRHLPPNKRRKHPTYHAAWNRLGRQSVVDLQALLDEGVAPKIRAAMALRKKEAETKPLKGGAAKLAAIPGPSRYEREHLNDAGSFGAGDVQRSNFAGRTRGGGPIYTGR